MDYKTNSAHIKFILQLHIFYWITILEITFNIFLFVIYDVNYTTYSTVQQLWGIEVGQWYSSHVLLHIIIIIGYQKIESKTLILKSLKMSLNIFNNYELLLKTLKIWPENYFGKKYSIKIVFLNWKMSEIFGFSQFFKGKNEFMTKWSYTLVIPSYYIKTKTFFIQYLIFINY